MFEHRHVRPGLAGLVALAGLAVMSAPLGAQESRGLDSLRREIARLDAIATAEHALYDSARTQYQRRGEWTELRVGTLHLRADARVEVEAREAAAVVAALIDSAGGEALRVRVSRHLPAVRLHERKRRFGDERRIGITDDTTRRHLNSTWTRVGRRVTAAQLVAPLAAVVEKYALDGADSALVAWVMLGRLPLREPPVEQWSAAYVELATAPAESVRRCRDGDLEACLTSLGLLEGDLSRLDAWYVPSDYRALLELIVAPRHDSATLADAAQCRESGEAAACRRAAQAFPEERVPLPLSADVRQLFVREVLEAGGPQAYTRLMAPAGGLRARLAAAAGMPLDSVAARWRARILAAQPEPGRIPPFFAVTTLAWCGLFTAIGVARRGAWR